MRSLRVLCLIAVALLGAACTSTAVTTATSHPVTSTTAPSPPSPTIAVDLSATPVGWVPVAFGDAQVSVPADWTALYYQPPCVVGHPPGEVWVNPRPGVFHCPAETAPGPSTLVELEALSRSAKPGSRIMAINGIAVRRAVSPADTYLVPSLGVQVTTSGVLAAMVLHTLTRSPRDIALASGPAPSVPSGWHGLTFRGLTFEAPQSWSVTDTAVTGEYIGNPCAPSGVDFLTTAVTLSTDEQPFPVGFCPVLPPPKASPPDEGIEVDAGSVTFLPVALSFSKTCLHINGLTACPASSPAYSILFLRMTVPGRATPVVVSIGLAGSGMVARTILYSLRA